MNRTMTMDELRAILIACAGGEDIEALSGDVSGVSFDELGYDSLALIETAAKLKLEHSVEITDEQITEVRSPGELLGLINDRIAA